MEVPSELLFHLLTSMSAAHMVTHQGLGVTLHQQTADVLYSSQEYRNQKNFSGASENLFTAALPTQLAVQQESTWPMQPQAFYAAPSQMYPNIEGGYAANDASAAAGYGYTTAGECDGEEAYEDGFWEEPTMEGLDSTTADPGAWAGGIPEEQALEEQPQCVGSPIAETQCEGSPLADTQKRSVSADQPQGVSRELKLEEQPPDANRTRSVEVHPPKARHTNMGPGNQNGPSPRKALWKPKTQ